MPELTLQPNLQVVCTDQYQILKDPKRLRAARQGIWNPKAAKMLSKVLDSCDLGDTIVHIHSWTKSLSSSPIREAIKRGFRVVLTLHDYFSACPNGGFFLYPQNQICHLRGMSPECVRTNCDPRSYRHKLWRVGRQAVQSQFGLIPDGIKHFIAVSHFSYDVLKPYVPDDASVRIVGNPISVPKRDPIKVDQNAAFVFAGELTQQKGPQLLAEASQRLNVETVFLGDGECRGLVSGVNPDATITGWILHREVMNYMAKARVLVFPSLWYEAQPLVPYEAAALGVPAIVSDSCAARDTVEDGVTGLLFKGGDVDDLVDKMAVFREAEVAREMGLAAYERYWTNPAIMELHVQRLEEIYAQILQP